MNTTNELPPPNLEQKMDMLIELVNSFRDAMLIQMQTIKADVQARYVDLRQRMDEMETRLTVQMDKLEQKIDHIDRRLGNIEISVEDIDARLDAHIRDLLQVKARVRELEATRELRH
jgi:chromosome segregation ATPase